MLMSTTTVMNYISKCSTKTSDAMVMLARDQLTCLHCCMRTVSMNGLRFSTITNLLARFTSKPNGCPNTKNTGSRSSLRITFTSDNINIKSMRRSVDFEAGFQSVKFYLESNNFT